MRRLAHQPALMDHDGVGADHDRVGCEDREGLFPGQALHIDTRGLVGKATLVDLGLDHLEHQARLREQRGPAGRSGGEYQSHFTWPLLTMAAGWESTPGSAT